MNETLKSITLGWFNFQVTDGSGHQPSPTEPLIQPGFLSVHLGSQFPLLDRLD